MLYLLLILVAAALVYVTQTRRSATRVIGPDDDPEFLRRLGQGDINPR